jgi:hypothetical protein
MNHSHSYKKAPRTKIIELISLSEPCNHSVIEIALSSKRTSQQLSLKQAENLAKKLLHLVDLAKVKQVMES